MAKEPQVVETIQKWVEEARELYEYIVPPTIRASLNSALNTFFSVFIATLVVIIPPDLFKTNLLKDGLGLNLLIAAATAGAAAVVREVLKRLRNEYDYEELNRSQGQWNRKRKK